MKRTIILHGHLHDKLPRDIEVEANSVAEALKYLQLHPELATERGHPHPVTIKDITSDVALFGKNNMKEIHVYPRVSGGGGKAGFLQIAIGVIIIAVAIAFVVFTGGAGLGVIAALQASSFASAAVLAGAMMIVGGLIQLLTPVPEFDTGGDDTPGSQVLQASKNTVSIGTRIPVLYGTRKVGGHYLSFDVDAANENEISPIGEIPPGEQTVLGSFTEKDVVVAMTKSSYALLPVFASQTAGLGNVPTDGFSP